MTDEDTTDWTTAEGARRRVEELLVQAGLPLELLVERKCQAFCERRPDSSDSHYSAQHLIYAEPSDSPVYREIDQVVQFYEEFEIGDYTGIQLLTQVPIECKHRSELEFFAFETGGGRTVGFPLFSDLAGSQLFRGLSAQPIPAVPTVRLVGLLIESGRTPKSVQREELVYTAGGALYDFIQFDGVSGDLELREDDALEETGVFSEFQTYLNEHRYEWSSVLTRWISEVPDDVCEQYTQAAFGGGRLYHMVTAHLPIVCVNGRINLTRWTPSGGIEAYESLVACSTTLRKPGWPGPLRPWLLHSSGEAPVVVTNPDGLTDVLAAGLQWHQDLRARLEAASASKVKRWALESAVFRYCLAHFSHPSGSAYRSDLDQGSLLWP